MSTRHYNTRKHVCSSVLPLRDLLELVEDMTQKTGHSRVLEVVKKVFQHFKHDPMPISEFFLGEDDFDAYDLNNPMIRYLLTVVVEKVSAQDPLAHAFISKIVAMYPNVNLKPYGINMCRTRAGKTYYRIRTGIAC